MTESQTTIDVQGLGHNRKRVEDARFIQGRGNYIDDIKLPGMLFLDIVRSPYAHARIKSIDTTKAMATPGVLAVITGETLKQYNVHNMPTLMSDTQMVLPVDTVKYQYQEVAGVLGTDRFTAADGVAAVEVDYDPLPVVIDPKKALEPGSPKVRDDKESNHIWHWEWGDRARTDQAFDKAGTTVAEDIYIPRIHVSSIETCGCVAQWDPIEKHLTLYMTTQAPHAIRTVVALVTAHLGLSEERIRVISPDIGGGFGGKVPVYPGYVIAIAASIVTGRPVKWIESRTDNLTANSFARDYHIHAEVAAEKDGKMTALRINTIADHGYTDAAANPSKFPAGLFHICTGSYNFKDAFVEVDGAYTNKPPGGIAYRCSFRVTEAVYTIERMTDILAHTLKVDPAEFRMRNFIQPEQFPYHSALGWEYDSGNYAGALRKAMDMIGYEQLREEQAEKRARGELMGIGISSFTEIVGAGPSKQFDILGIKMFELVRDPRAPHRQGHRPFRHEIPGPGARDHLRPDHRRRAGHPGGPHQGRRGRYGHGALRPGHLRQPQHAHGRGGRRHSLAQDPRQVQEDRRAPAGSFRRRPGVGAGQVLRERLARSGPRPSRRSPLPPIPTIPRGWKPGWKPWITTTRPT